MRTYLPPDEYYGIRIGGLELLSRRAFCGAALGAFSWPDRLLGQTRSRMTPTFAFALYSSLPSLDATAIARAHSELNPHAPSLIAGSAKSGDEAAGLELGYADGKGNLVVVIVDAAIPAGETEAAEALSVSRFAGASAQPFSTHSAHAIVALAPWDGSTAIEELMRLSWGIAAIAKSSAAVAVYWGSGSVTHPAEFFTTGARNSENETMLLPLWLGVSYAPERSGVSFLTFGVRSQFQLLDLKVWSPNEDQHDALEYTFNLASYVIGHGNPIAAGETVGRTNDERLIVRYEQSPVRSTEQVMCVDLPDKRGWWPFKR